MVIRGRVHQGVVVLEGDVRLDEGQQVVVVVPSPHTPATHSILDIPSVSIGAIIERTAPDDDLLAEMLEDRA